MPQVPKRRRSKLRQGQSRNTHGKQKVAIPKLVTLPSGKRVPRHLVTPENPIHKGIQFIRSKKK